MRIARGPFVFVCVVGVLFTLKVGVFIARVWADDGPVFWGIAAGFLAVVTAGTAYALYPRLQPAGQLES